MKLHGLKIDGFGVWHDLRVDDLSESVTGFYGPNEAGKTTLMHFIRTVLYGFSPARRKRFLPPVNGGKPGGWLDIELSSGAFRLERYADTDAPLGRVVATGPSGKAPPTETLHAALSDIDEATFNNVYAVGLQEMQELGALSDIDAARWLYSLTTGVDRVSLLDVTRDLEAAREAILSSNGQPSEISKLRDQSARLKDEIDQLVARGRKWSQITLQLAELDHEVISLDAERGLLEFRARTIEIGVQVKPLWRTRAELDARLKEFDGRVRLPDDAVSRLESLKAEIEEHDRQRELLRRQRETLLESAASLGVNEMLVRSAARIEALGEQRDWLEALERQQVALDQELTEIQSKLASENENLGVNLQGVKLGANKAPEISEGIIATLRPHARAVRACREKLASAQQVADHKQTAEGEFRLQLESAMPDFADSELPTNLEEAGELVANLRKRLHVEQRLEQSKRQEVELHQQNHDLLDRQEVPLWTTAVHYAMVAVGAALLLAGYLAPSTVAGVVGGLLVGCVGAIHFFRYLDEDHMSQRREACHRQLSLVRKQLDSAEAEKAELDHTLGKLDGSVVVRLQTAERHLAELEKLVPVESRRREALLESESAARRMADAERKLEAALMNWRGKLKAIGLPEEMSPSDIRALASQFEHVTELRLRAERRRGDVEQRRREYAALCKRIHNLAEETHLLLENAKPLQQLEHLESSLRQQWLRVEERDQIHAKAKDMEEEESRHARAAEALRHRRESTFAQAGVDDEASYIQLSRDQLQADKLRKERTTICREIAAAIGTHVPEQEVAALLAPDAIGSLDRLLTETTIELEDAEDKLKEVIANKGGLARELKQLAEDRTLTEKQLDLAEVEEQLKRAIDKWRSLAVASLVLNEILNRYERERQPETLIEASGYLNRLTNGGYHRIWTPLGKELLFVDNAKGESLAVDVLSRGTREQLFLSLRLALVALLARRGVQLPMVLDDVLVNFDEGRARQAVRVLGEFAADGHQLLIFTCHEHVRQMFGELEFDTRHIPLREGAIAPEPIVKTVLAAPAEEPKPTPKPKPKKKRRPAPSLKAPEPPQTAPVDPPFDLVESFVEYAFDGDLEHLPPKPADPPPAKVVEPLATAPRPKRRRVRRHATKPVAPVFVAPPRVADAVVPHDPPAASHLGPVELHVDRPLLDAIVIEPVAEAPPAIHEVDVEPLPPATRAEPDYKEDEWIRIGPQVRRREHVERRGTETSHWVDRDFNTNDSAGLINRENIAPSLSKRVDAYLKERAVRSASLNGDRAARAELDELCDDEDGDAAAA